MKKRLFGLLLAGAMLLSGLTLCVGAAGEDTLNACGPVGFKDPERITYTEAVSITGGLGLFSGTTDDRFDPRGTVTRAQMATIVVKMLKGADFNADSYKGEENPFPDTAAFESGWAEGYVNACVQLGIVKGYGDGTFQPANPVTTAEALTMVLNALKVDAGAGEWPATVMNKASELKLADGLGFAPASDKLLNREQLAVIVSAGVQYKPEGGEALLSSVFGVKSINTEHKFEGDFCTVCRTAREGVLTRADLEQAVAETAWAYLVKGDKLQYCSQVLDKIGRLHNGHYRVNEDGAPEFGTEDQSLYAVCSDWADKVWLNSVGHRLVNGDRPSDSLTDELWGCSENQPDGKVVPGTVDPITEGNEDFCVMRWMNHAKHSFTDAELFTGVDKSPYFANFGDYHLTFANGCYPSTKEEQAAADKAAKEFLLNWEKNLRPGDVLCSDAHALLYVGNGCVLDCTTANGGGKYNLSTGLDIREKNGSVHRIQTMEQMASSYIKSSRLWFTVLRPTKGLVTEDHDGILANDIVTDPSVSVPAKTVSRMQFPAMEIDRTASVLPYQTMVSGEEVTYTVKVSNRSNHELYVQYHTQGGTFYTPVDYKALPITETIPAGTQFVSATGDYKQENGKLSWTVDVPVGQTAEVSYTVKVTAPVGNTITNDGGFVADIPSNELTHTVGGKKPNAAQLTAIADTDPTLWREKFNISRWDTDMGFVNGIYRKMGIDLQMPALSDLVINLFPWTNSPWLSIHYRANDRGTVDAFMVNDKPAAEYRLYRDMLVENYWGGYQFYTGAEKKGTSINEFSTKYLEPGDVVVYVTMSKNGVPYLAETMVYAGRNSAGEETLLSMDSTRNVTVYAGQAAEDRLWNAFLSGIDLFFVLRPSQAMDDVNEKVFDAAKEPVYEAEPVGAHPAQMGTTVLTEQEQSLLSMLDYTQVFGLKANYIYNIYDKIGLPGLKKVMVDEEGEGLTSGTAATAEIFKRTGDTASAVLDRTYDHRSESDGFTATGRMLLSNFYGGSWLPKDGTLPTISDLQIGDAILMGNRYNTTGKTAYADEMVAVYQGEGRFLLTAHHGASRTCAYGRVGSTYAYGTITFTGDTVQGEFRLGGSDNGVGTTYRTVNDLTAADAKNGYVKVDSFEDMLKRDPITGEDWMFFYVLRPTQGVYDIHDLSYAPQG